MPTPPVPRVELIRAPDRLVLRFRAPRGPRLALGLFLTSFLAAWVAGVAAALSLLGADDAGGRAAAGAGMWLALWIAGGAVAVWGLFRSVLSTEVVEATPAGLAVKRVLGPLATGTRYEARRIRDLRHEPASRGTFAFGYGDAVVRFGPGTPPDEAAAALAALRERLQAPEIPPKN